MQIIPNPLSKLKIKKNNAWRMTWRKVFRSVVSQRLTHALLQNSLFSFSILIHCNGAWITASTLLCVSATFFWTCLALCLDSTWHYVPRVNYVLSKFCYQFKILFVISYALCERDKRNSLHCSLSVDFCYFPFPLSWAVLTFFQPLFVYDFFRFLILPGCLWALFLWQFCLWDVLTRIELSSSLECSRLCEYVIPLVCNL